MCKNYRLSLYFHPLGLSLTIVFLSLCRVTFAPDAPWSGWDFVRLQSELEALFRRRVDLAERAAVETSETWTCRQHILEHAGPIYIAR